MAGGDNPFGGPPRVAVGGTEAEEKEGGNPRGPGSRDRMDSEIREDLERKGRKEKKELDRESDARLREESDSRALGGPDDSSSINNEINEEAIIETIAEDDADSEEVEEKKGDSEPNSGGIQGLVEKEEKLKPVAPTPEKHGGAVTQTDAGRKALKLQYIASKYEDNAATKIAEPGTASKAVVASSMAEVGRQNITAATSRRATSNIVRGVDKEQTAYNREQFSLVTLQRLNSVWGTGTNASVESPEEDSTWRDLEDCIPCMQWSWGDVGAEFDKLLDILQADLDARIDMFKDLGDIFKGNPLLEELCQLLHLFKNLCPQDLIGILAMLAARIMQIWESMKISVSGLVKDIIAQFLRPYIMGLQDLLNVYGQFLWNQVDCVLDLIQTTAEAMSQANAEVNPWSDPKQKNWMDSTAEAMKATDAFGEKAVSKTAEFIAEDMPGFLMKNTAKGVKYIGDKIDSLVDVLVHFLTLDLFKSKQNLPFRANLMAVATLIDVIDLIIKLNESGLEELCKKEKIEELIDRTNDTIPNARIFIDEDGEPRVDTTPEGGGSPGGGLAGEDDDGISGPSSDAGRSVVKFSLKSCLNLGNPSETALLERWAQELR